MGLARQVICCLSYHFSILEEPYETFTSCISTYKIQRQGSDYLLARDMKEHINSLRDLDFSFHMMDETKETLYDVVMRSLCNRVFRKLRGLLNNKNKRRKSMKAKKGLKVSKIELEKRGLISQKGRV